MNRDDTIVAIASPPGASPCGILRLSGPRAIAVADTLFTPETGPGLNTRKSWCAIPGELAISFTLPRVTADRITCREESCACPCLVYLMRSPKSYTGEDLIELQVPGSMPLLQASVRTFTAAGARIAEPGEFTLRAFLNGRIDLGQAESIERVISARSEAERKEAMARLSSSLGRQIATWKEELLQCAAMVEAELDFTEEAMNAGAGADLRRILERLRNQCASLSRNIGGSRVPDGIPRARVIGLTNAGKSSLVNALVGREAVMVSSRANTTRDWLEFPLDLKERRIILQDSAGQDPGGTGMVMAAADRSLRDISAIDLACLVVDMSAPRLPDIEAWLDKLEGVPTILVLNKSDLAGAGCVAEAELRERLCILLESRAGRRPLAALSTSARTGAGLQDLRAAIQTAITGTGVIAANGIVSVRESAELGAAATACARAMEILERDEDALVLVAEELRTAHNCLGRALGEGYGEEVLRSIFSRFCIGK